MDLPIQTHLCDFLENHFLDKEMGDHQTRLRWKAGSKVGSARTPEKGWPSATREPPLPLRELFTHLVLSLLSCGMSKIIQHLQGKK